jgi:hypothetical protein
MRSSRVEGVVRSRINVALALLPDNGIPLNDCPLFGKEHGTGVIGERLHHDDI